jgi:dienelactone hydrolase
MYGMEIKKMWILILFYFGLLMSCSPVQTAIVRTKIPLPRPSLTAHPSVTPYPTPTRAPTWTPEPSQTPADLIFTPSPYSRYAITSLRLRQYGGGQVQNLGVIHDNVKFTRYSIRYPSDGLNIDGYMNIPKGDGPFPVIITLHGYLNPEEYETLDYTTAAADGLAGQGFVVIHTNFRNFHPSDKGDSLFRVGYAVDVLNLIGLIRQNAGKEGLLQQASSERIGLWSHSMGGNIALRVAVVSSYVKAILLYAPMSGDEQLNSQYFENVTHSAESQAELQASVEDFAMISPNQYYKDITAAIQLHHGTADSVIPVIWSEQTCKMLKDAGTQVECYFYADAEHTFRARFIELLNPRMDTFFAAYLKKR